MSCQDIDVQAERVLERLEKGAAECACAGFIAAMEPVSRCDLYTRLIFERLERKIATLDTLHQKGEENWNNTLYYLYFRTLGDKLNQQTFLELAERVPYRAIMRERLVNHAVESMLLGTSGLLALYPTDSYLRNLQQIYDHLSEKYEIEPMDPSAWTLSEIRPANHPVLRLAQAAEFLQQDELLFNHVMACRNEEDIHRLFSIESSEYWRTHYIPGTESDPRPKRIGRFKADIIGINLVAVLQFAYGSYMCREELRESALSLLEQLPAEDNRYMRSWQNAGLDIRDAFESQALLQLSTEYCAAKRCRECAVGKRVARIMTSGE